MSDNGPENDKRQEEEAQHMSPAELQKDQEEKSQDTGAFGQPKGLRTLSITEFCERFSYYGMRAILIYYMYDTVKNGGLGFSQSTAASIMSIYGSLIYMASVVGGYVSDRILGPRRTVLNGGILIMIGHIVLALPLGAPALFFSIILITLGTGLLKPNASNMVGTLYSEDDARRDAGFSWYYLAVNIGAFVAPWVVGGVQKAYNYHAGFSVAAIGMFLGLLFYVFDGRKTLPEVTYLVPNPIKDEEKPKMRRNAIIAVIIIVVVFGGLAAAKKLTIDNVIAAISILGVILPAIYFTNMLRSPRVTKVEKSRVKAYFYLFCAAVVFWSIQEQGSSVLAIIAANKTQLHIGGMTIQPSAFQSLDPLFVMIYTPIFAWIWTKLGDRQPSSPTKFSLGLLFAGLSFIVLVKPLQDAGSGGKISPWVLVISWALVVIGEMLISPIGMSVTTKLAPKAYSAQMMSLWYLADAAGQAINSQIVKLFEHNAVTYFGNLGLIAIAIGAGLAILTPKVKELMQGIN